MTRKSTSLFPLTFLILTLVLVAGETQAANPGGSSDSPVLIVACDRNYPPFTQLGADGNAYGMLIDLWRLWAEKTDHRVEFLMTDWPNTLTAIEDGKADFHSGLFHTAERSLWMDFLNMDEVQRVKYRTLHRYQRGKFKPLETPRLRDQIHAGALLEKAELIATINSGLSRITHEEWRELEARWIVDPADRILSPPPREIELDPKEIAWLAAHPNIRIGADPDYAP